VPSHVLSKVFAEIVSEQYVKDTSAVHLIQEVFQPRKYYFIVIGIYDEEMKKKKKVISEA